MMAYEPSFSKTKRSKGRSARFEKSEVSMLPIMNLMVVLIPVLLSAAEMVKIRILNVSLPAGVENDVTDEINKTSPTDSNQKSLDLNLVVTKKGFIVSALGGRLRVMEEFKPYLTELNGKEYSLKDTSGLDPEIEAEYKDGFEQQFYEDLNLTLVKLKDLLKEKKISVPDINSITISADKDIDYQTIVNSIDAVKEYSKEDRKLDLFPIINFGG